MNCFLVFGHWRKWVTGSERSLGFFVPQQDPDTEATFWGLSSFLFQQAPMRHMLLSLPCSSLIDFSEYLPPAMSPRIMAFIPVPTRSPGPCFSSQVLQMRPPWCLHRCECGQALLPGHCLQSTLTPTRAATLLPYSLKLLLPPCCLPSTTIHPLPPYPLPPSSPLHSSQSRQAMVLQSISLQSCPSSVAEANLAMTLVFPHCHAASGTSAGALQSNFPKTNSKRNQDVTSTDIHEYQLRAFALVKYSLLQSVSGRSRTTLFMLVARDSQSNSTVIKMHQYHGE